MTEDGAVERPRPLPVDEAERGWRESAHDPEMLCESIWSEVCRAWWSHPSDDRLRRRAFRAMFVDEPELRAFQARRLDEASLVRVHGHVIATRAGVERDLGQRSLDAGLRTTAVFADRRDGGRFLFFDAKDVREGVGQLADSISRLPDHAFVRAAWITQAVGAIHPFVDGNGGTSRFLASLELTRRSLPPLNISLVQRNTSYIRAVAAGSTDLRPMQHVVYDTVQAEIAAALFDGTGDPCELSAIDHERFARWQTVTEERWTTTTRMLATFDETGAGATERLARRGFGVARSTRCVCWRTSDPLPLQLELAVSPLIGGDERWLVATITATIGDGTLGLLTHPEYIPSYFIAPSSESDESVHGRFDRWMQRRIDQVVRGIASWM